MDDQRRVYPPPPWQLAGECWWGLFRADRPVPLPDGLRPVLGARQLLLGLVRYRAGTLCYDELIVGALALRGLTPGIWVHDIWVDSPVSMAGGRAIWGLPKQLASFHWPGAGVTVADGDGILAALDLARPAMPLPPLPAGVVAFGRRKDGLLPFPISGWFCPGLGAMRLTHWSPRFGYHLDQRPLARLAAYPFRATFHPSW
ncbi:MAG TPA: acetoacetate decarboxylase family protein [Roseiflexaceae bacterium]|nr:acetoacetate decarboxylase family protein [Roseiflexaceae bacterium]